MVGILNGWVADFSGKPAEVALDLAHFNPGTVSPRHEAKSEGRSRALQEEGFHGGLGLADDLPLLAGSAVKLEGPGAACDEHQLAHPDLGVKPNFSRERSNGLWISTAKSGPPNQWVLRSSAGLSGRKTATSGQRKLRFQRCDRLLTLQPGKMRIRWSGPRPILIAQARSNPSC